MYGQGQRNFNLLSVIAAKPKPTASGRDSRHGSVRNIAADAPTEPAMTRTLLHGTWRI